MFTDISAQAGIDSEDTQTPSIAWGDYDNDGDEYFFRTNKEPDRLYRNDGGGNFSEVGAEVGVAIEAFNIGAAFGDLDKRGRSRSLRR